MLQHKIKLKKLHIHLFRNTHTRTHARTHTCTDTHSDTDTHMQTGTCAAHTHCYRQVNRQGREVGSRNKIFRSLVHGLRGIMWFWVEFWTEGDILFSLLNFLFFCFDPFTSGEVYFRVGQFSSFKPVHNEMQNSSDSLSFVIDMCWQVLRRTPLLYCGTCQREKLRPLSLSTQRR